jgi:PPOX class probable F420-dependent enzyme
MNTSQRDALLNDVQVAVLATAGPGGRPHAAPIWYLYEDGEFLILTGDRSQKRRNVERQGDVTLVVDQRTVPYYAVMVQGRAQIEENPSTDLKTRLAVRYLGEEMGRAYVARGSADDSVTIRVRPTKIIEFGGTAGGAASE